MLLSLSFLLIIAAMWNGNVLHSAVWYQSAMYRTEVSTAKKNGESSASWNEREEELNVQRLKLRKCNLFLFEPSTVYKRYYSTSPLVREASFDPVGMVTMIAVWQNLFEVCFHGTVVKRWDPFCTFFFFTTGFYVVCLRTYSACHKSTVYDVGQKRQEVYALLRYVCWEHSYMSTVVCKWSRFLSWVIFSFWRSYAAVSRSYAVFQVQGMTFDTVPFSEFQNRSESEKFKLP